MSYFSRLMHSRLEKNILSIWIVILVCLTVFFSFSLYQHYNASIFYYDDNLYMNEANSLLHGHGFTINVIYPVNQKDLSTKVDHESTDANLLIEKYPDLRWEYSRAPVFFISLATFFGITKADPSNWITLASIFNTIVSTLLVTFYFIFARRYFGTLVGIFSSAIIITSLIFMMGITTAEPNQLTYLFIVLSLLFLNKSKSHYILFAIFAALANLTNQVGIMPIASYGSYLLFKREYKGLLIVLAIWLMILSPWMITEFYTFHDFGIGLSIPFSSEISSVITSHTSGESPSQSDTINHMQSPFTYSPFKLIYEFLFTNPYHTELIKLFLPFLFITYLSISKIKIKFDRRILLKFLGLSSIVIISIFGYLQFTKIFFVPILLDNIIQILIIFSIIISFVILHKRSKSSSFFEFPIPRSFAILGFFVAISTLILYYSNILSLGINDFVAFPLMFFGLPLGIYGIKKALESAPKLKQEHKTIIFVVVLICIIVPISYFNVKDFIPYLNEYGSTEEKKESAEMISVQKLSKNVGQDIVLVHSPSSTLFLRTGNPVIPVPEDIIDHPMSTVGYFFRYNATYLIISKDDPMDRDILNLIKPMSFGFVTMDKFTLGPSMPDMWKIEYSNELLSDPITKAVTLEKMGRSDEAVKIYNAQDPNKTIISIKDSFKNYMLAYLMGYYEANKTSFNLSHFTNSTPETVQARNNLVTKIFERIITGFPNFPLEARLVALKSLENSSYQYEASVGYMQFIDYLKSEPPIPGFLVFKNQSLPYSQDILFHYENESWTGEKRISENSYTNDPQSGAKVRQTYDNIYQFLKESMKNSSGKKKSDIESTYLSLVHSEIKFWQQKSNYEFLHDVYQELTSYDQFNKEGWLGLATTAEKSGDTQEAVIDYQYYLKLSGNSTESVMIQEKIDQLTKELGH